MGFLPRRAQRSQRPVYGIFLVLLFPLIPLNAEKIVQCIANFPVEVDVYTRCLQRHGYEGKVVLVDIKEYEKVLLKKNGKWWKRLHLDFLNKVSLSEQVDKIIFFNLNPKITRKYDLSRLPKEKLILFMWEPKTVLRHMYSPDVHRWFSQIYTWDDSLVDGQTYFKFHYPCLTPMKNDIPSFEQKKFCTQVSSDLSSSSKNELYTARKQAIQFFEQVGEEGFEFYGKHWQPSLYKSYRGACANKIETVKNYRFCICYENTHSTPGYITEKIFDCFAAGTIPVYWGASNIEDYIPKECFIDRRQFNTLEELYAFLKAMTKEEFEDYLVHIRTFLSSTAAQKFTQQQIEEDFYLAVTH